MEDQAAVDASFFETRDALTRFLFLKDDPAAVDLCLVLGSPTVYSMAPAVELYLCGLTERILISGLGPRPDQEPECESFKRFALAKGVPERAILLERQASNTLENFVFSGVIIERELGWNNVRAVAVVGKPFHMRRALMTARKQWPAHVKLVMQPSTDPRDMPAETWWRTADGRRYVLSELTAIGSYALQDHIGGF